MNSAEKILENIILESNRIPWLPPLWELLFQEGMRGNHLVFNKLDANEFKAEIENLGHIDLQKELLSNEELEEVTLRLLCCSDLNAMVDVVEKQSQKTRKHLFVLYLRILEILKQKYKKGLN